MDPDRVYCTIGGIPFGQFDSFGCEWVFEDFEGWEEAGTTLEMIQKPRQAGGWAGDSFAPPRIVSASGQVVAPTSQGLTEAFNRLKAAISLTSTPLLVTEPGTTRWANVRRSGRVIARHVTPTVGIWSWQVAAKDPRLLGAEISGSTFLPSSSGGLAIPFTVPFTIDATTVSGQVNLTNPGNETGPVRMRVDGPTIGPVITHVGTKQALVFASSLTLGAGEWLDIDMEKRQVLANGQSSRNGYITSRGWSGFDPGPNTWAFTAQSYDPASKLTVFASPADQ